jgi:hypothetical protein
VTTIEQEWIRFAQQVLPVDAPQFQIRSMRKAFFGGCCAMLHITSVELPEMENDAAIEALELILAEIKVVQTSGDDA